MRWGQVLQGVEPGACACAESGRWGWRDTVKSCQVRVHLLKVADGCRRDAVKSCQVPRQVRVHVLKAAGGGWREAVKESFALVASS